MTRHCQVCGEDISHRGPRAIYCERVACRVAAHRQNVRIQNRRSEGCDVENENANPQVSDVPTVTSSAAATPSTPDPVTAARATRCGCPDCLERVAHPGPDAAGHDFWDRMILRVVAETEPDGAA